MTNTLLSKDYENAYNRKKSNAESRGIGFHLSQKDYIAIMKSREVFTCGYTQRKMVMHRGFDHADYPELDRINPDKAYRRANVIFCTKYVHGLKTKYVEMETSRKGLSHQDLCVIRSIEKTLNQSEILEQRLKPYQEIFDKIDQRHAEEQAKETQRVERQEASDKQKKINKVKAQMDEQRALADHYSNIYDLFKNMGLQYGLSFKEHRDKLRISRSALSKVKFTSLEDKYLWIPDKVTVGGKGIVEKGDFIVCFKDESELLDKLSQTGNLKTIALNALKHI